MRYRAAWRVRTRAANESVCFVEEKSERNWNSREVQWVVILVRSTLPKSSLQDFSLKVWHFGSCGISCFILVFSLRVRIAIAVNIVHIGLMDEDLAGQRWVPFMQLCMSRISWLDHRVNNCTIVILEFPSPSRHLSFYLIDDEALGHRVLQTYSLLRWLRSSTSSERYEFNPPLSPLCRRGESNTHTTSSRLSQKPPTGSVEAEYQGPRPDSSSQLVPWSKVPR